MERLNEVDIMRSIAILLVVFTHCYAIYTGAWKNPDTNQVSLIPIYLYIDKFLVAFRMPVIVFIAGYVFKYFQPLKKHTFMEILKSKFNRLLIPTYVFGVLLIFTFGQTSNVEDFLIQITNGPGHLWFLPMLFWCFVIGHFLVEIKKYKLLVLLFLYGLGVISNVIPNYLGFSKGLSFIPYFYLGMLLIGYREKIINSFLSLKMIFITILLFLTLFSVTTFVISDFLEREGMIFKSILSITTYSLRTLGLFTFYIIILFLIKTRAIKNFKLFRKISKKTYGIYVFHQFILLTLIYKLSFFNLFNNNFITPIILFTITTILSIFITNLFLQTRVGKYLIG